MGRNVKIISQSCLWRVDILILVTLGTQDKSFVRLLNAIEYQIKKGVIKEPVIVQAGYTKYNSDYMQIFDFISKEEFDQLIKKCDVLITHGGVGSIIEGLKNNKKVIAAPRLAKYKEHTNDHQIQIIKNFSKRKYIIALWDFDELGNILINIDKFVPAPYNSNQKNFVNLVRNEINKLLKK